MMVVTACAWTVSLCQPVVTGLDSRVVLHLSLGMAWKNGLYKVKCNGRFHLMRVSVIGGKKMYRLDHGLFEPIEKLQEMEGYIEVVCEVNEKFISRDDVRQQKITISWCDHENREFRMTVRDVWALRNILLDYPFLKDPFQYTPRKTR
jgi:hypothetical protein